MAAGLSFFSVAKTPDPVKPLRDTLGRIQKTKMVEFQVEKKVVSELMAQEKSYQGRAFLSGPLFRFETKSPEKSLVVYDGKVLWVVQYPDPELGGPIQVLRGKVEGPQKDQMLLTELLAKGKLLQSFEISRTGESDGVISYEGLPKEKGMTLQKVMVQVKSKDKELKTLEYIDDVGNKTSLHIQQQKLLKDARPELFRYRLEKGAQVTDI